MKRFVVALVLVAGVTAVALASFTSNRKKADTEKKVDKKEKKKECKRSCLFS